MRGIYFAIFYQGADQRIYIDLYRWLESIYLEGRR